jgi:glycosyltransferase involved in cell wall biosynthesis
MRACMVSYSDYESDSRVRRYAELLLKNGYRVDIFSIGRKGQQRKEVIGGCRVYRIQTRAYNEKSKMMYLFKLVLFFIRSTFFLTWENFKESYDVIHVHSVPDFEVFAAMIPKLMGSKVILDIHDIVPEFYASKFNVSKTSASFQLLVVVEQMSVAFSDHVIAANHIWGKRLKERSATDGKCTTILNFPEMEPSQLPGKRRDDGRFVILYPGTLNYHQGVDIAIRAFARIKDKVPEADFHVYGQGDQWDSLTKLVDDLGLQDRVFLRGLVPTDQIASLMENADLGVVPKRKNGFGNEAFSTKILEFMVLNVPLIIPDTTIDRLYFNDSVALFFQAGDEISLSEAMLTLIKNPGRRASLAKNAREFVKKYAWEVNKGRYLNLVESLVHSGSGHSG